MTVLLLFLAASVAAQDQTTPVANTSVCDVMKSPSQYNGKIVEIRGAARLGFEFFGLTDVGCGPIWLDFADESIRPTLKFRLVKDEPEKRFRAAVQKGNTSNVTLIGRIDGVDEVKHWTESRPVKGGVVAGFRSNGFGHMGQYKARLVIIRVRAVE